MAESTLLHSASFQSAKQLLATSRIAEHAGDASRHTSKRPSQLVTLDQNALVSEALQVGFDSHVENINKEITITNTPSHIHRCSQTTTFSQRLYCKVDVNSLDS